MNQEAMTERKEAIVAAAYDCLCSGGAGGVSMKLLARRIGCGEATLYRHFVTRENLLAECGIYFWKNVGRYLEEWRREREPGLSAGSGLEGAGIMLEGAMSHFRNNMHGYRLIYELDGSLLSRKVDKEIVQRYEEGLLGLSHFLWEELERGQQDGSIRTQETVETLYYAVANGIFGMMQKQAGAGELLSTDRRVEAAEKVETLGRLILGGLKA